MSASGTPSTSTVVWPDDAPRTEIDEQTTLGNTYVRSLMRSQLRAGLAVVTGPPAGPPSPGTDDARTPGRQGLYDPQNEHDACGVGFVVDIKGRKSHQIVSQAIQVLINLTHRGACGCEENTRS